MSRLVDEIVFFFIKFIVISSIILLWLYVTRDYRNEPKQQIRIHPDGTSDTTYVYTK